MHSIIKFVNKWRFFLKAAEEAAADSDDDDEQAHPEEPIKPNVKLEAGKKLPPTLEDFFLPEHIGWPLEDIDEFYQNKKVLSNDKSSLKSRKKKPMKISCKKNKLMVSSFSWHFLHIGKIFIIGF